MTRSWIVALALLTPAMAQTPPQPAAETWALCGGTVHLGTGDVLEGGVVVVRGREILAVQPSDAALPEGCVRIDADGQHVYPGLIDANSVLGLVEIGSVPGSNDRSELGDIDPALSAEVAVNPDSELLPVARTGGVLWAHVGARSRLLGGASALIRTAGTSYEDMTVAAPLVVWGRWPTMALPAHGERRERAEERREELLGGLSEALAEARAYRAARTAEPDRPRDPQWEALQPVLDGLVPLAIEAETVLQLHALLDWAEEERVRVIAVGAADGWRVAARLVAAEVPVILDSPHRTPMRDFEPVDTPFRNAGRLHAAGVRLAFGTGPSGFGAANARNLRLHVATAITYGLPRAAAERALGRGAAEILGVDDHVGSLAPGCEATLFVADGDVFDATTHVTRAWVAGEEVSLVDRQRRLYERARGE